MKRMIKNFAFGMLVASTGIMGCSDEGQNAEQVADNGVLEHTADESLKGQVVENGVSIAYEAQQTAENGVFLIKVDVGGHALNAMIDYGKEKLVTDGYNAVLTGEEKGSLLAASEGLFKYISGQPGELSYLEMGLVRMMEYWSRSPEGYVYKKVGYKNAALDPSTERTRDEGIRCVRRNTFVTAQYDDRRGSVSERVLVGSRPRAGYGCMGRCGADCGWGAPSAWTKDCLDHDQCSHINRSSGGSRDANCGREFDHAADDWAFGVSRRCFG